ncbi:phosphate signaling complex protein PhoU [Haliovirga abyssi]|uniref:Phosphate transport system regulatory protein PhoU n=1 Tax=Haliovirga abyssi TaxID=2996794 RepID=A0AAU9DNB2_9FUSO|nr:phosphate signaling complex protein PhoU [Haliovirga abyssi]BDU49828.1 phosphate transport system regulatory protein PhoU [Haliovirga abyssi]
MKSLNEAITEINSMEMEMIKDVKRLIEITIEELNNKTFDKSIYGEGKVLEEDTNDLEVQIDEKTIGAIARYQPAARDLRFLIGIMHMNKDLERMADLCINILKTAKRIFRDRVNEEIEIVSLIDMGEKVYNMFEIFNHGYIEKDVKKGYIIFGLDDEVDKIKKESIDKIKDKVKENIEYLDLGIENLLISKNYERIADNITNLAESLIYIYRGEDLRHQAVKEMS